MKICLLNDSFPPAIDGVVNVVMNYAEHMMMDRGAEIEVGTPYYPDGNYEQYPYKIVPYQSFNTAAIASGYRTGNPFAGKAVSELAAFGPDIIHTHCPMSSTILARFLREQTGAPIVFTYHTKYDIDIERVVRVRSAAREAIRAMVSNIEACDEVWVVSKGAGENLKALGFQGDCRVVNNGVDFEKGRVSEDEVDRVVKDYDLPSGVPVFLFVGRLMTYKGLPLILDALKLTADAGMDFRMVFIGKGPDRELLEKQAESLGIAGKCIFVGPVYDRNVLRAWNTRADLFLFPSTFDTNGLVVREAAACGLASVLIEGSCAAEGVTDGRNGFLIRETPEAMAELLLRLSGDLNYLHQAGEHAMEEIYLSWKDCAAQAYDRYQVILDRKNSGALPERKKLPADYLLQAASYGMEEQEKHRRIRRELFDDFRESAVGMMENYRETEENLEQLGERLRENLQNRKNQMKENIQDAGRELKLTGKELKEEFLEAGSEIWKTFRNDEPLENDIPEGGMTSEHDTESELHRRI